MLKLLKQARAAFSMLSADEVRRRAEKPIHFGLVADNSAAYSEMDEFLLPAGMPPEERAVRLVQVHRAHDPEPPEQVDLVLYEPGIACPESAFNYHRDSPGQTVKEIL